MSGRLGASPLASCPHRFPLKSYHRISSCVPPRSLSSDLVAPCGLRLHPLCSSKLKYARSRPENSPRFSFRCHSSTNPAGPSGQENETKTILDAFFLGKALAEALNERVESTLGEFLSTIGRLQAEQQKQVQDFQEEVLERARKAKEKAAREAMEAQGLVPKSSTESVSTVSNGVTSSASGSASPVKPSNTSVQPKPATTGGRNNGSEDPLSSVPIVD